MINPFAEVDWDPDVEGRRKFALSQVIGFPCLAGVLAIGARITHGSWFAEFAVLAIAGVAVGAVLWVMPRIARPLYVAWYFLACCIGAVMGNLLLIAVYFFVVTPIGLMVRWTGRSGIRRRVDRQCTTYWKQAERVDDPNDYYRQF